MTEAPTRDSRPGIDPSGLMETFRGRLIGPADPDYESARAVWNGMIDKRPGLIAKCSGTADIVAAVNFRPHERPARGGSRRGPQRRRLRESPEVASASGVS